jgi:hypothetical protein
MQCDPEVPMLARIERARKRARETCELSLDRVRAELLRAPAEKRAALEAGAKQFRSDLEWLRL